MGDVSSLSEQELAELCALADGTLPDARRVEVEAWVATSAELQELVERQRRSVLATRALERDEEPASLRAAVEAGAGPRPARSRSRGWRLGFAAAVALSAAALAASLLTGGPGAPSVADAARLANRPPAAPLFSGAGARLGVAVDGLAFPNFLEAYGWQPIGVRSGKVGDRNATVVYYTKGERTVAYVIVEGSALAWPDARSESRDGVEYRTLRLNDKVAVTWRRDGHTCILVGDAAGAELLKLASWQLSPR